MEHYFSKVHSQTSTRFWINNPTVAEMKLSLEHGVVHCTTNPTYSANMIQRDPDFAYKTIDQCLNISTNDSVVAQRVQELLIARIMEHFKPLYEKSNGSLGLVSIQGDPYAEVNADHIIHEGRSAKKLGPNYLAKIPVTKAGLIAIETLLAEGVPVIATEIFAISQMIAACEAYNRAFKKSGKHVPYFITHITGIFDEYLKKEVVDPLQIDISPEVLSWAGLTVARKQYNIFKKQGFKGIMLGGGARTMEHFTGVVGEEMHVTINWNTAEELIQKNPPVTNAMSIETPKSVIDELTRKLPDFAIAYDEKGLTIDQFATFGPVERFRRIFLNGWDQLLQAIASRRTK